MNLPKWQVYTAFSLTCFLLVLGFILNRWQISISVEQPEPETSPVSSSADVASTALTTSSSTKPTPVPTLIQTPENDKPSASNPPAKVVKAPPGALRLSNQTNYPVRIAFLARRVGAKSTKLPVNGKPAHWDFAPGEGGSKGLVLSLPEGFVKLEKGDILVAFAQDGSGRYWGPYIVGETASPVWNDSSSEWHLILQ